MPCCLNSFFNQSMGRNVPVLVDVARMRVGVSEKVDCLYK